MWVDSEIVFWLYEEKLNRRKVTILSWKVSYTCYGEAGLSGILSETRVMRTWFGPALWVPLTGEAVCPSQLCEHTSSAGAAGRNGKSQGSFLFSFSPCVLSLPIENVSLEGEHQLECLGYSWQISMGKEPSCFITDRFYHCIKIVHI